MHSFGNYSSNTNKTRAELGKLHSVKNKRNYFKTDSGLEHTGKEKKTGRLQQTWRGWVEQKEKTAEWTIMNMDPMGENFP